MDEEHLTRRLVILAWGAAVAGLASIARTLRTGNPVGPLRMLGGVLGAGIASFSYGALVSEFFDVSNLFLLGSSGIVGWLGGDVLAALGAFLERKFGIALQEDAS